MNAYCGWPIVTQGPTLRKARFQFKAALSLLSGNASQFLNKGFHFHLALDQRTQFRQSARRWLDPGH